MQDQPQEIYYYTVVLVLVNACGQVAIVDEMIEEMVKKIKIVKGSIYKTFSMKIRNWCHNE